jgi:hypothetical protein
VCPDEDDENGEGKRRQISKDNNILTAIAGDIAGSLEVTAPFLRKYFIDA